MIKLEYSNKYFDVLDGLSISNSSRQVTFSDVVIDFTGKTMKDLPIQYQEVRIWKNEQKIYTGYVNSFDLPSMKKQIENRELYLNLLSPMKMTTNRVVTIIGTYKLSDIIKKVFEQLQKDGFTLKEVNVRDGQKTVNFLMQTVEFVMNNLANTETLWWHINEKKEIFVNSIDYMLGNDYVLEINHDKKLSGWLGIEPSVEAVNYANVINVKNARVYYDSITYKYTDQEEAINSLFEAKKIIKKGETINFSYPVDISEETIRKRIEFEKYQTILYALKISGTTRNNTYKELSISFTNIEELPEYNQYLLSNNISFDEKADEKDFVLHRDNFFPTLITGMTYNGEEDLVINDIRSNTVLKHSTMKFIHSQEIEINKGKITESGIIEKVVNMNDRWFFMQDLVDEVRNLMTNISNQANILKLEFDKDYNLELGNLVKINLPNFFAVGDYIITDINKSFEKKVRNWKVTLRSSDVFDNFIDLFREKQTQEIDEQVKSIIISEYVEEKVTEVHEVVKYG